MSEFRVWAPLAQRVDLAVEGKRLEMTRLNGGCWGIDYPCASDADYGYCLDGGEPLPDPRSGHQPYSVHGLSRLVDHARFKWQDQKFQPGPLELAIIYELHVGTFTAGGTFESAIELLDHLIELGVSHVELLPVFEFPGDRGWGYDGTQIYAPHRFYGGPDGLKRFVNACHHKGLAVIFDVVYNHFGPEGCYLGKFGPYFTDHYKTPWGQAVNFDGPQSDPVRQFIIDNALMWLRDYHADGLRLDAVHAIYDSSAVHILEELRAAVADLQTLTGKRHFVIGESALNDPRVVRPTELGGYGLDAQWSDDFHHALHTVLTGEQEGYYVDFGGLKMLAKSLTGGFVYDGQYSEFRKRQFGRPYTLADGRRLLGYIQNHDQTGNRARGERIGQLVSPRLAEVAAALVLASPFVPMIFAGEEWNASTPFQYFAHFQAPDLAEAVIEGRRKEFETFGWSPQEVPDPQAAETFERCRLNWSEIEQETHRRMLDWYRLLIRVRRQYPDLANGRMCEDVQFDERAQWLIMRRGSLLVACNFSKHEKALPVDAGPLTVVATNDASAKTAAGVVQLSAESVAILEHDIIQTEHAAPGMEG